MLPTDFGLSILASWLANLCSPSKLARPSEPLTSSSVTPPVNMTDIVSKIKMFETYDMGTDFDRIYKLINQPVAHILIEDAPSTFWNLAGFVIESTITGEWFVFRRNMAFQGSGGGLGNSKRLISTLHAGKTPIAIWVYDKTVLDALESGQVLWPDIRDKGIPLVSSTVNPNTLKWIKQTAAELLE